MKTGKIVVVGGSNTDLVIQVPHFPAPGQTVIGNKFMTCPGGKGANQAVSAARAGGRVALVSRVGSDSFGEQAIAGFRKERIDVRHVGKDAEYSTGVALIFVARDGENSIGLAPNANSHLSPRDIQRAASLLKSAGIVMAQLEIPLATVTAAVRMAHASGVPVILNPAPGRKLSRELLARVTYLTPNETECEILTEIKPRSEKDIRRAAAVLLSKGVKNIIFTLGARGAYIVSKNLATRVPGFKVKAVDTTAAGDVFNGALATALLEEKSLIEAVRFANAAAALSVTKMGAQSSAPFRRAIDRLLSQ